MELPHSGIDVARAGHRPSAIGILGQGARRIRRGKQSFDENLSSGVFAPFSSAEFFLSLKRVPKSKICRNIDRLKKALDRKEARARRLHARMEKHIQQMRALLVFLGIE
jgi:hypothetical protein